MNPLISSSEGKLIELKNSYLLTIGQIVLSFNTLEKVLVKSVSTLMGGDLGMTTRVTAGESFMSLRRLLNVLFRYRVLDKIQLARLGNIDRTLETVDRLRNEYMHSEWFIGEFFKGFPFAQKYKTSKGDLKRFKAEMTSPPIKELNDCVAQIDSATIELANLMTDNYKQIRKHRKETERIRLLPITN